MIGLADVELDLGRVGAGLQHLVDVGQRLRAIEPRLAAPEQVEVGAVQDKNHVAHLRRGKDIPICRLSMSVDNSLSIRVNGEHRRVNGGISLVDLLNELGLDPLRVAVERNLAVVPRGQISETMVEDGDDYEIVHFVGGG